MAITSIEVYRIGDHKHWRVPHWRSQAWKCTALAITSKLCPSSAPAKDSRSELRFQRKRKRSVSRRVPHWRSQANPTQVQHQLIGFSNFLAPSHSPHRRIIHPHAWRKISGNHPHPVFTLCLPQSNASPAPRRSPSARTRRLPFCFHRAIHPSKLPPPGPAELSADCRPTPV